MHANTEERTIACYLEFVKNRKDNIEHSSVGVHCFLSHWVRQMTSIDPPTTRVRPRLPGQQLGCVSGGTGTGDGQELLTKSKEDI